MARANHTDRVRYHRGKASGYPCKDCGKQAEEWSQIHGTRGDNDPVNFEPRCRPCHYAYDKPIFQARARELNNSQWTEERRAQARDTMNANRAALVEAQWTEEKREVKRQETIARNRLPVSEETRKRMSESHKGKPSPRRGKGLKGGG